MAKTIPLNSDETVWVTTYSGGSGRGTMFDISMQLDEETQLTASFTVDELKTVLLTKPGHIKGLAKPDFDRGPRMTREEVLIAAGEHSNEPLSGGKPLPPHTHVMAPDKKSTWSSGGDEWHYHQYFEGEAFTSAVLGHKHPVYVEGDNNEIIVGTSIPV